MYFINNNFLISKLISFILCDKKFTFSLVTLIFSKAYFLKLSDDSSAIIYKK